MTVKTISTYTCDGCGKQGSALYGEYSCGCPPNWADVSWEEPPGDGEKYRKYKSFHLCPDCRSELLGKILAKKSETVTGGDVPPAENKDAS